MALAAIASSAARLLLATVTGCQLTTAWGLDVAYEHYWTPQWHQSLVYNAYMGEVRHGYRFGQRDAVRRLKALVQAPARRLSRRAGCNNNWDIWGVGSRLQWDVTKSFYIGVEAIYQKFDSAQTGLAACADACADPGELRCDHRWRTSRTGRSPMRMHKDFLP